MIPIPEAAVRQVRLTTKTGELWDQQSAEALNVRGPPPLLTRCGGLYLTRDRAAAS